MSRTMTISSWQASNVTWRCSSGSSCNPPQISAYMRPTRPGVSTKPSRSGSSPMAIRISRTAFSIRAWSTPEPFPSLTTSPIGWRVVGAGAELRRAEGVGHAELGDHRAGDLRGALDVVLGTRGGVAEHELLGGAATEQHRQLVAQLRARLHVLVLGGQRQRPPERPA